MEGALLSDRIYCNRLIVWTQPRCFSITAVFIATILPSALPISSGEGCKQCVSRCVCFEACKDCWMGLKKKETLKELQRGGKRPEGDTQNERKQMLNIHRRRQMTTKNNCRNTKQPYGHARWKQRDKAIWRGACSDYKVTWNYRQNDAKKTTSRLVDN